MIEKGKIWSGRGDLNARPPAPKAEISIGNKCFVCNCVAFMWIWDARWSLLILVEPGGSRRLQNYLQFGFPEILPLWSSQKKIMRSADDRT